MRNGRLKNNLMLRKFVKRKSAVIALAVLLFFALMALIGPMLCSQDPYVQNLTDSYAPVSWQHWLGTDQLGRDTFTRLVYGSRVSLGIAFAGVLMGSLVGVTLGVIAGYFGGLADMIISRSMDIILSFPGILIAIVIVAILGLGTVNTTIAVAIFIVPSMTRIVRGNVMGIINEEYISASKAFGISSFRIIMKHIIPNVSPIIIVNTTLDLGGAILVASSLSFLGLGVQAPNPEWGAMLSQMREVIRYYPLGVIAPGTAITLVVLSFSLFGDGLRDALDPKVELY